MPLTSDIALDASRFAQENISEETKKLNATLEATTRAGPNWYDTEVGVEKYRELWEKGKGLLPAPEFLHGSMAAMMPSRNPELDIPVRVYRPDNRQPSRGIFLHFHGGGWVLGTHREFVSVLLAWSFVTLTGS